MAQLSTTLEVMAGATLLRLAPKLLGGCLCGGGGQRTVGARVEVRDAVQDWELRAQRECAGGAQGARGARGSGGVHRWAIGRKQARGIRRGGCVHG